MRYPSVPVRTLVVCALIVLAAPAEMRGQTPAVVIGQLLARQHLVSSPAPSYPMIAQAAKVAGAVNVDVTVAPDGRVIRAFPLGGPPMLQAAAETGVRGWRFRPFITTSGEAVIARTVISVLFGPQPSRPALEALVAYGDAALGCTVALDGPLEAALPLCAKAYELEVSLTTLRQGPQAGLAYALTLSYAGRHDEALEFLSQTEKAFNRDGWTPAEEGLSHLVRARAERTRGNLRQAAERYDDAYNLFALTRRRVDRNSPLQGASLAHQRRIGPEWAEVLDQLGRQRDAERVRARVQALD